MTSTDVLDDPVRLAAVEALDLEDQLGQERFHRVTRSLGRVLAVPISRLHLVAQEVLVVSGTDGGTGRTDRATAFCAAVVQHAAPLLVPDARADSRWAASPGVRGEAGVRAYAGVPVRGPGGQVVGTLCVLDRRPRRWTDADLAALHDVARWAESELARGDLERQRALGLLAVERMKDELISVVSHELRTPLTGLKGSLGLLAAGLLGALPAEVQRVVRIALDSTDRLARLVDEISDLERLSAGQVVLDRRPHRVSDLVGGAVAAVVPQAEQAGVAVRTSVSGGAAWVDGPRIVHALTHLVENAVRASRPGAIVDVRATATVDGALLEVEDRGCGIDPQDLARAFDPFTRGDSSDSRVHGGAGLGLALARSVVEAHGGRLTARSELARGTTIGIVLPQRTERGTGA